VNGQLHIAILAAGSARRFGGEKLDILIAGRPLGRFALDSASALDGARRAIVVADPVPGFARAAADQGLAELIVNPHADQGLATSVSLAAHWAAAAGSSALLLMLADMPLVASPTLRRLAESAAPGRPVGVRHADGNAGIPACFPAGSFAALQALRGDRGAASLLRRPGAVTLIDVDAAELLDIDLPADLERLAALRESQGRGAIPDVTANDGSQS
jgi:molybdenum cofactor cytidylyltransferase